MQPHPQTPHRWPTYLAWFFSTATLLVLACAAFNYAVDALGIFGAPRVAGFNAIKPHLDHHRELSRWQAARRVCAPAGIFGNSRAEIGLDPEHPALVAQGGAFNHAIPGTGLETSQQQLNWLKAAGCSPRTVVLGVEFFDFLGGSAPAADGKPGSAPRIDASAIAETLLSLSALGDSLTTLALQRSANPATITPRGFNPLLNYNAEVKQSGHHALFRQRATENLKNWSRKPRRLLTGQGGPSSDQLALESFLRTATASADTVHVVIYPYHAQIRLMMVRLGLSEMFTEWKASIVATAQRLSTDKVRIQVWDFSALSTQTLEPIPPAGDRQTRLQHYWEAGHYKKELGDQMLGQMLASQPGFGKLLDPAMLQAWLEQDQARVRELLAQPSALRSEVDSLFQR
jgi:hypothetical protein